MFKSVCKQTIDYFSYYAHKRNHELEKIRSVVSSSSSSSSLSSAKMDLNPICMVIPTVALHIGINAHDYVHLCERVSDYLRQELTTDLFVINEKSAQSLKTLMGAIALQWEESVERNCVLKKKPRPSFKRGAFNLKAMLEHIAHENEVSNSIEYIFLFFYFLFSS